MFVLINYLEDVSFSIIVDVVFKRKWSSSDLLNMKEIHCLHSHSHSDARNVKARISFFFILTFHISEKKLLLISISSRQYLLNWVDPLYLKWMTQLTVDPIQLNCLSFCLHPQTNIRGDVLYIFISYFLCKQIITI